MKTENDLHLFRVFFRWLTSKNKIIAKIVDKFCWKVQVFFRKCVKMYAQHRYEVITFVCKERSSNLVVLTPILLPKTTVGNIKNIQNN